MIALPSTRRLRLTCMTSFANNEIITILIYFFLEFSLCSSREIISLSQHRKEIQQFLVALSTKSGSNVYNPKFTTPTSLPLDLFCGYQLLQGSDLMLELGDVYDFIKLFVLKYTDAIIHILFSLSFNLL